MSDSLAVMVARVPYAPLNVQMLSSSATNITIGWTSPNNGGTAITTYRIYSDLGFGNGTFTEIVPSTGIVNSYVITTTI